jgi:hypothetical protein
LVVQSIAICAELNGADSLVSELLQSLVSVNSFLTEQVAIPKELNGVEFGNKRTIISLGIHMPSLESQNDDFIFPSSRLHAFLQKIEYIRRAYAPLLHPANFPAANRVNLKRLQGVLALKSPPSSIYFTDAYYTWLALFQDAFSQEYAIEVSKSIVLF